MKQVTAESWINALAITLLLYSAGAAISGIVYLIVGIVMPFEAAIVKIPTIAMAILALALAPLLYVWGRALWERKPWSRILVLVFAGLGALLAIFMLIGGIVLVTRGEPRSEILGTLVLIFTIFFGAFIGLVMWLLTHAEITAAFGKPQAFAWNDATKLAIIRAWALLTWVSAAMFALAGVIAILISPFIGPIVSAIGELLPFSIGVLVGIMLGVALVLFIIAAIMHFVAKGLWELQEWARIVMIVLAWVSIVFAAISFVVTVLQYAGVMQGTVTAMNVADSLANFVYGAGIAALEIWFLMQVKHLFGQATAAKPTGQPRKAVKKK